MVILIAQSAHKQWAEACSQLLVRFPWLIDTFHCVRYLRRMLSCGSWTMDSMLLSADHRTFTPLLAATSACACMLPLRKMQFCSLRR